MKSKAFDESVNMDFYGSGEVRNLVEDLKSKYLALWWETKSDFPIFKEKFDFQNKLSNERRVEKFRKELRKELHKLPEDDSGRKEWNSKILCLIKALEQEIVGKEDSSIDFFASKGYSDVTEMFIREVRDFDSNMDVYDIFQAIRNVWIMNSIQILFNMKVRLTPSIFSYSMLYPYSDNYLDDTSVSVKDKINFNNRFRRCLSGEKIEPLNSREKCIFLLVQKIENEFSRLQFSQVFESLLSIHTAQEKSLKQQRIKSIPYQRDIIGISFEKGGTSVLADGYLVKGTLSKDEADFMFGYGVFLQLIDDLQDVEVDLINGHMTIFSQIASKWTLDKLTNKLFWFVEEVLNSSSLFITKDSKKLREVIHASCIFMILEAMSKTKSRFSRSYIKEVEECSKLRFSYIKKLKRKFQRDYSSDDIHNICIALGKEKP